MKKSRKLLCVLLALVMVVSLLPVMAFAADEDVAAEETTAATVEETSPETEGVVGDVIKNLFAKLPNYLVAVKTSDGRVAAGAQVVIYNQNKDQVATAVANYGVAIFSKKDHLNTYSVSATWTDPNTNIKYQSLVGFNWSFGQKPDIDVITVYPTIDMILNTTDHNAYIKGYPDGTVRPDGRITRAEVATILDRRLSGRLVQAQPGGHPCGVLQDGRHALQRYAQRPDHWRYLQGYQRSLGRKVHQPAPEARHCQGRQRQRKTERQPDARRNGCRYEPHPRPRCE